MDPGETGFGWGEASLQELGAIWQVRGVAPALDVAVEGRLLQRCVVGGKGESAGGQKTTLESRCGGKGGGCRRTRGLEKLPEGGEGELQVGREKSVEN